MKSDYKLKGKLGGFYVDIDIIELPFSAATIVVSGQDMPAHLIARQLEAGLFLQIEVAEKKLVGGHLGHD